MDNHTKCRHWCKRKTDPTYREEQYLNMQTGPNAKRNRKLFHRVMEATKEKREPSNLEGILGTDSTQVCENANMRISKFVRKDMCYSRTKSLKIRISHVIGEINLGFAGYHTRLYEKLGIPMSEASVAFFTSRDRKSERGKQYKKKKETKVRRMKRHWEKMASDFQKHLKEKGYYSEKIVKKKKTTAKEIQKGKIACCHCGIFGHARPTAKTCLMNKNSPYRLEIEKNGLKSQLRAILTKAKKRFNKNGKVMVVRYDLMADILSEDPNASTYLIGKNDNFASIAYEEVRLSKNEEEQNVSIKFVRP